MNPYVLLSFIVGFGLGYLVFYFRYEHKDTVNELRSNLKEASKELHHINIELEEFTQQNTILKEKMTEILEKNDELSEVVSELSKYYYHMKKASEKTAELIKFLQSPDEQIEEKMERYIGLERREQHSDDNGGGSQFF